MAILTLDAKGLKCPQPTLKITVMAVKMKSGDVLEVVADCDTFEKDVRDWCVRTKESPALDSSGRQCKALPDTILILDVLGFEAVLSMWILAPGQLRSPNEQD